MNISTRAYKVNNQVSNQSTTATRDRRGGNGPDDVKDEFDNRRRGGDGPDDVYDEFDNRRDSGGSSYDSWGGGGGGSDYIGGMLI